MAFPDQGPQPLPGAGGDVPFISNGELAMSFPSPDQGPPALKFSERQQPVQSAPGSW